MRNLNRVMHTIFYMICLFIAVSVLTMQLDVMDKVIHTFAWVYIVLLYAYFFDEKPPRFLRVEYLYGAAKEEYYKEYVDELITLSQHSLSLMRKIQMNEDYKVVNRSISELEKRYLDLKRLSPPDKYHQSHLAMLDDVKGFLNGLESGDYRLVQAKAFTLNKSVS